MTIMLQMTLIIFTTCF